MYFGGYEGIGIYRMPANIDVLAQWLVHHLPDVGKLSDDFDEGSVLHWAVRKELTAPPDYEPVSVDFGLPMRLTESCRVTAVIGIWMRQMNDGRGEMRIKLEGDDERTTKPAIIDFRNIRGEGPRCWIHRAIWGDGFMDRIKAGDHRLVAEWRNTSDGSIIIPVQRTATMILLRHSE